MDLVASFGLWLLFCGLAIYSIVVGVVAFRNKDEVVHWRKSRPLFFLIYVSTFGSAFKARRRVGFESLFLVFMGALVLLLVLILPLLAAIPW